jgi:hypothetical protein
MMPMLVRLWDTTSNVLTVVAVHASATANPALQTLLFGYGLPHRPRARVFST